MADLLVDTGPLVALLNADERYHAPCVGFLKNFKGQLLSTEPVLAEGLYLLSDSFLYQKKCMEFVLESIRLVPASRRSLRRSLELMEKYRDLPMDFADATLVTLAEETQISDIFTLDRRSFETCRWGRNRPFRIHPEPLLSQ